MSAAAPSRMRAVQVATPARPLACILAGIAGITYGSVNAINTGIVDLALLAFPAALLGGLDSISGSLVGHLASAINGAIREIGTAFGIALLCTPVQAVRRRRS